MNRAVLTAIFVCVFALMTPSASSQDTYAAANALEVRMIRPVSRSMLNVSEGRFTPAGQLTRVHVEVTNRSGRARTFEYQFEWFDADGVPRQTLTASQSLFLDAGETQTLVSVGQRVDAVNARLTIGQRQN